ncbi:hypothetical protein D0439_13685 [Lysinibacillus fusiformis]|jgi:hypothetical protein|uniref:hypothetical protein n=1 Tax=Lysinibacillus TaxID=400634 RepID=UPI0004D6CA97|nr:MULTISPECIES: hypothetical protein [Lysinibacillus]MDC6266351.1 hypothetical protein [Lysinibacillus sphaericus]AJK88232.1 hypothetical protein HR49_14385 [Lysinibacillus fusiformis]KAB0442364.1 hypothetical protein CH314_13875 [Lysinibacillus fusiformis]KGA84141.1 hypothetical protein KQ41_04965 [Lysinibacillus fusiformis]KHK50044.1 hypothetical protein PI85_19380 [Lysinibacillus sp. A1]
MKFDIGDMLSTTVLLCLFLAIFFGMIRMIKKMKATIPVPPPPTMQQQVEDLTKRVTSLEHEVNNFANKK